MITEETGKRIAVALERLIVLLEKQAHPLVKMEAGDLGAAIGRLGGIDYQIPARRSLHSVPRSDDDAEGR